MSYARNLARLARTGAPTVDTAQALRDMPIYGGLYPERVETIGALADGDGGGGAWRWDPDGTADDNLGTVLLPTGHVGPGRWVALPRPIYAAEQFGVVSDGAAGTDNHDAIQAAMDWVSANGGGTIAFRGVTRVRGQMAPRSHVTLLGVSPEAEIIQTEWEWPSAGQYDTNLFFSDGLTIDKWESYDQWPGACAGKTFTFDTAGDAANFAVGDLVILRTEATGAIGIDVAQPLAAECVKIVAVGAGTVTFAAAPDALFADARLVRTDAQDQHVEAFSAHNIALTTLGFGSGSGGSAALRLRTAYNCHFDRVELKGYNPCPFNALTKSSIRNSTVYFQNKTVELKSAACDVLYENITFIHYGVPVTSPQLDIGEYARNLTIVGCDWLMADTGVANISLMACAASSARNVLCERLRFSVGAIGAALRITTGDTIASDRLTFRDIRVDAAQWTTGVFIQRKSGDDGESPTRLLIDGLRITGEQATNISGAGLPYSMRFDAPIVNSTIRNCDVPGLLHYGTETPDLTGTVIEGLRFDGWSDAALPLQMHLARTLRGSLRAGMDDARASAVRVNSNTQATTAEEIAAWSAAPGTPFVRGDRVQIVIRGDVTTTNGDKYWRLSDGIGPVLNVTVPAASQGAWSVVGTMEYRSNEALDIHLEARFPGVAEPSVAVFRRSLDIATTGLSLTLECWLADAADLWRIVECDIRPELVGETP